MTAARSAPPSESVDKQSSTSSSPTTMVSDEELKKRRAAAGVTMNGHSETQPMLDANGEPVQDNAGDLIYPLEMDLEAQRAEQFAKHRSREVFKFLWGAGGIYVAFLYYGSLQEDVFRFKSETGETFQQAWFLQFLEALANVCVGMVGRMVSGGVHGLPLKQFFITGASQVSSKAFTSLALAKGLSFPVATLAKSGKMAPVMAGQLVLGGASYSVREYLQVAAIILGTVMLSMAKKKSGPSQSTPLGVFFILLSLVMDGVTAGIQKRLKQDLGNKNMHPTPYDFMLYTNVSMMAVAFLVALLLGEIQSGLLFFVENPVVTKLVVNFSICSAIGQSFIFYTVAHFDPLVCSTVTTTRKIFSVMLSIFLKGHELPAAGWAGVSVAVSGILAEVQDKISSKRKVKMGKSSPQRASRK